MKKTEQTNSGQSHTSIPFFIRHCADEHQLITLTLSDGIDWLLMKAVIKAVARIARLRARRRKFCSASNWPSFPLLHLSFHIQGFTMGQNSSQPEGIPDLPEDFGVVGRSTNAIDLRTRY
jgi:hypothetical protein